MPPPSAITVRNLRKTFRSYEKEAGVFASLRSVFKRTWKEVDAVDDLSFSIPTGSFVGFLGPNGAGKTTTIKMLTGILTPSSGQIDVLGYSPQKRERVFKKQIALVMGQKTQLIWDLPAMDTFLFHRDLYEVDRAQWNAILDPLTELLGVGHVLGTPVRQLSLGERMKCEIILALLHQPKVLFLDEPTIGLDVISQSHLWSFLKNYQKQHQVTILLTSHYVQDIANLCEDVIIINRGKKMYDGKFSQLVDLMQPERHGILRFRSDMNESHIREIEQMVKDKHLEKIDPYTYRLRAQKKQLSKVTERILRDFPVEEVRMEEVDLREVIERAFASKDIEGERR